MERESGALTPLYARPLLRLLGPFPNFDFAFIKPLRAEATRALRLQPGNRVLDVGCGIGGGFPLLAAAVGPTGEVLGVEISPAIAARAQRRIDVNRWSHVSIVQASAQTVQLDGKYDALVMFAAPDVYASPEALQNLLPHLRPRGRIVLFGAKRTDRIAGKLLNPMLKLALTKLSFETTPLPNDEPWRLISSVSKDLEVREYFFGTMFLAAGTFKPA